MYEAQEGAFNWSALEPAEKRLAAIALVAGVPPFLVLLLPFAEKGYHVGQWFRGGDAAVAASEGFRHLYGSPGFAAAMALTMLSTLVCAWSWWRFSLRQDELFHRIQGFVLARIGVCAIAGVFLWWMASLPGWVGGLPLENLVYGGAMLFSLLSAEAWRRWG